MTIRERLHELVAARQATGVHVPVVAVTADSLPLRRVHVEAWWNRTVSPFQTPRIDHCLGVLRDHGVLVWFGEPINGTRRIGVLDPSREKEAARFLREATPEDYASQVRMYVMVEPDERRRENRVALLQVYEVGGKPYYLTDLFQGGDFFGTAEQLESLLYWIMAISENPAIQAQAFELFGEPVREGALAFPVYQGPPSLKDRQQPPVYRRRRGLWYDQNVVAREGVVVNIEGQNYHMRWPGLLLEHAPWQAPERAGDLILTPTQEPITPPLKKGRTGWIYEGIQVWGKGYYQQTPIYAPFRGQPAVQFLCVPRWQGQDFSGNVALAIDPSTKVPARVWFNGSCT